MTDVVESTQRTHRQNKWVPVNDEARAVKPGIAFATWMISGALGWAAVIFAITVVV